MSHEQDVMAGGGSVSTDTMENCVWWLPTRVMLNPVMPWVSWMFCRNAEFSEPFFDATVLKLRGCLDPGMIVQKKLRSLNVALENSSDSIAGFIFHVSRCGSTLTSNYIRHACGSLVLAEPQPVCEMLTPYEFGVWPFTLPNFPSMRDALLQSIISRYALYAARQKKKLIVKFVSWNTRFIPIVLRLWPMVPTVVLIRHPIEVAVSNMRRPTAWLQLRTQPAAAKALLDIPDAENISSETYLAAVLSTFYRTIASVRSTSFRIVDYRDLNNSSLREITSFFGLEAATDKLDHVLDNYSKDASSSEKFQGDSNDKQRSTSVKLSRAIDRWALPEYDALTNRRAFSNEAR